MYGLIETLSDVINLINHLISNELTNDDNKLSNITENFWENNNLLPCTWL